MSSRYNNSLYIFALFFVLYETITYLSNDMIMPGMIDVVSHFNESVDYVAVSLFVFILGNTSLQLFIGPLCDRYGKRKVLIAGNLLFLLFSLLIAVSSNIQQFMLGRFLEGSGIAFVAIGYAIIHKKFNDKSAVKLISIMGNITILAPLLGPVFGVFITNSFGWRAVFVVIAAISSITLLGLFKYTPSEEVVLSSINLKSIIVTYFRIAKNRNFLFITASLCIGDSPIIAWIGLAPVFIIKSAGLTYKDYLWCQIIAIGGMSAASIAMQFIAGKFSFYSIMKTGSRLFLIGALLGVCLYWNPFLFSAGLCILGFGLGLYNGMAWRLIMSYSNFSQSMTISLVVFVFTIAIALTLELSNLICQRFNYNLLSFAVINLLIGIIGFYLFRKVAKMNKKRAWM